MCRPWCDSVASWEWRTYFPVCRGSCRTVLQHGQRKMIPACSRDRPKPTLLRDVNCTARATFNVKEEHSSTGHTPRIPKANTRAESVPVAHTKHVPVDVTHANLVWTEDTSCGCKRCAFDVQHWQRPQWYLVLTTRVNFSCNMLFAKTKRWETARSSTRHIGFCQMIPQYAAGVKHRSKE